MLLKSISALCILHLILALDLRTVNESPPVPAVTVTATLTVTASPTQCPPGPSPVAPPPNPVAPPPNAPGAADPKAVLQPPAATPSASEVTPALATTSLSSSSVANTPASVASPTASSTVKVIGIAIRPGITIADLGEYNKDTPEAVPSPAVFGPVSTETKKQYPVRVAANGTIIDARRLNLSWRDGQLIQTQNCGVEGKPGTSECTMVLSVPASGASVTWAMSPNPCGDFNLNCKPVQSAPPKISLVIDPKINLVNFAHYNQSTGIASPAANHQSPNGQPYIMALQGLGPPQGSTTADVVWNIEYEEGTGDVKKQSCEVIRSAKDVEQKADAIFVLQAVAGADHIPIKDSAGVTLVCVDGEISR